MSDERWRRIEETFHRALERSPEARPAFLDHECGEDEALRQKLEILLAHEKEEGDTFRAPLAERPEINQAFSLSAGTRLGAYGIVDPIGSGGMGEVYRATDTRLGRDVALKVLPAVYQQNAAWLVRFQVEARMLASLNHPHIATIHGLEESHGLLALAMELVEGETLAERLARGPIPYDQAVAIAKRVAEALEYAHQKGVIHRDLKPANVMLTRDGGVKLLDFGLARQVKPASLGLSTAMHTGSGEVSGTAGYMSPEQALGLPLGAKTDLFSFGVVLYEMLAGERPFQGDSMIAVIDATLHAQPRELSDTLAPGKLKTIIRKLLEKEPGERYDTAGAVLGDLQAFEASRAPFWPARRAWIAVWALVLVAVLASWLGHRWSRERWAIETARPEIERLIGAADYAKAAALTRQARAILPKDAALEKLWIRCTGEVPFTSDPTGADVSFRQYRGDPNGWQLLGKTPLKNIRMPHGDYVWRISKPGFTPFLIIGTPAKITPPGYHWGFLWNPKLWPAEKVPAEMVVVPAGVIPLSYPVAVGRGGRIQGEFLIDQHEVTNAEYKKFVDAGGYGKADFWKQPFIKDGRAISWREAMELFRDSTGRFGPGTWEAGDYPKGREKHPVAGVSWFEAAAYAEFAGKSLPTVYHWTMASQSALTPLITPGSNFLGEGTRPVGSPGALSGFGTTDMAGNVKEWCWNETSEGRRFIMGGGFGEPNYMFYYTDAKSPWSRLPNFGFRCAKYDAPLPAGMLAPVVSNLKLRDYSKEKPVPDEVFRIFTTFYVYDKGELNPRVEPMSAAEDWTREKVTFDAAYGGERVMAYLLLPKNAQPPFQTIVYFPGGFAFIDDKFDLAGLEEVRGFLLRSGRAVIAPIYKGLYERHDGLKVGGTGANPPAILRDHFVAWVKDLGRSIDYLETRKDIDAAKIGYFGDSLGGTMGGYVPALEKRIKTAVLSSGGLHTDWTYLPETDPFNFVRHVTIPVLMLNGRYDSTFPVETSQRPLFENLGTPAKNKKYVIYETGHGVFSDQQTIRECLDWFDKYLGPVRRR